MITGGRAFAKHSSQIKVHFFSGKGFHEFTTQMDLCFAEKLVGSTVVFKHKHKEKVDVSEFKYSKDGMPILVVHEVGMRLRDEK